MPHTADNLISAELNEKELTDVQSKLADIKKKLSFLIQLSADEKRMLLKPGANALVASESLVHLLENNATLVPKSAVDTDEMRKDLALVHTLTPLYETIQGLADMLNDTLLAAKSDVYRNALKGYALTQVLGKNMPGVESALAPLKEILDRPARAKKKPIDR